MKTIVIAAFLTLVAASAEAGLSGASQPAAPVQTTAAETNSVSVAKPVVKRATPKPVAKKKHKPRREDDDEIKIDID